jgi:hypothetical protein
MMMHIETNNLKISLFQTCCCRCHHHQGPSLLKDWFCNVRDKWFCHNGLRINAICNGIKMCKEHWKHHTIGKILKGHWVYNAAANFFYNGNNCSGLLHLNAYSLTHPYHYVSGFSLPAIWVWLHVKKWVPQEAMHCKRLTLLVIYL